MISRTQASSMAWSDISGNSSPRQLHVKRLSSGMLPVHGGARNEDIVKAINQLRNDVAKYELQVMESTNDAALLESLNEKLEQITALQQKTDSGGTEVDK